MDLSGTGKFLHLNKNRKRRENIMDIIPYITNLILIVIILIMFLLCISNKMNVLYLKIKGIIEIFIDFK